MLTIQAAPTPFDPNAATPAERLAVGQLLAECFAFAYPQDPPLIPEQEALSLGFVTPGERIEQFVVWADAIQARALAWGALDYSLEQNLHLGFARVLVHPGARRRGLGHRLASLLQERARQAGHTTLTCMTTDRAPAGAPFAQSFGMAKAIINRRSQLELSSVSEALLNAWLTRPDAEPYRLHLWSRLSEDDLARFAELTMVMNTAPRGELDYDDWMITPEMLRAWESMIEQEGETRWTAVIEDTLDGQLVGYSELYWNPLRASIVNQGATAVRVEARGQGLGKWLKAALLRQIASKCPGAQYIRTSNAEENAAMLGINVKLGFSPWAETIEWQLKLEPAQA